MALRRMGWSWPRLRRCPRARRSCGSSGKGRPKKVSRPKENVVMFAQWGQDVEATRERLTELLRKLAIDDPSDERSDEPSDQ